MVLYEVQIRPLHPKLAGKVITNKTATKYTHQYQGSNDRTYTQLDDFSDMLFYFNETKKGKPPGSGSNIPDVFTDTHLRLDGDFWQVYASTNSLKEAKVIAKQLIEVMGIDKVKIAKITPISSEIIFSENE